MFNIYKNIKKYLIMFSASSFFVLSLVPANVVYAHYISSTQEKMIGKSATMQFESNHKIVEDENINALEYKLVGDNSDKLTVNVNDKRYLEKIKVVSDDKRKNAFTFPGGFIYITQGIINKYKYPTTVDGKVNTSRSYNYDCNDINGIYKASNIAGVMAHEMGHWYHEDYLRSVDRNENINMLFALLSGGAQQTISSQVLTQLSSQVIHSASENGMSLGAEKDADKAGIDFVDNTRELSTGGMAYIFYDYMLDDILHGYKNPTRGSGAHSNNDVRLTRILDYWNQESNGLISFHKTNVINDKFTYKMALNNQSISEDDKYFCYGLLPDGIDVSSQERTFYFAGQLAKAMKKGYVSLNTENNRLYIVSDEYVAKYYGMKTRSDGLVLVAFNSEKNDMILLNRLDYLKNSQLKFVKSNFNILDNKAREEYNALKYISDNCGIKVGFFTK